MNTSTTELMHALSRPDAYDKRRTSVDVVQTHISLVFLVDDRAYKVKKPVDLGFLDFTQLQDRRHFCEEEVRLNRRLAPDAYLGVARIMRESRRGAIHLRDDSTDEVSRNSNDERDENVIDYAVVMKRLPAHGMLDQRLAHGEVDAATVTRIADLLVPFHDACPTGQGIDEHAEPAELRRQARENFESLNQFLDARDAPATSHVHRIIDHLQSWTEQFLDDQSALFQQRIERGRIREGHGDLHARNICIADDQIIIYDCIEFSSAFRCRDVACEIAFLAMDLDFHGRSDLSQRFVERYIEQSGDEPIRELISFYQAHLAIVRAKVEALRSMESEVDEARQTEASTLARRYLQLAAGYSLSPAMILMCGLPATGKSHVARQLAHPLRAQLLQSDVIRKRRAGLNPTERTERDNERGIYSPAMTEQTYASLRESADSAIRAGQHVIIDATLPSRTLRAPLAKLAESLNVPWILIHTTATDEVVRERMRARARDSSEVSDADLDIYRSAQERFERPIEIDADHRIEVDHTRELIDTIDEVIAHLCRQMPEFVFDA